MVSIKYAVHRARNIQLCGRHRFSFKYNETGDLYSHRFHYWIWIGFMYYISNNPIIFVSVNHFRRITGAINQITIFIEHHRSNIYNNSNADTNG